MTDLSLGVYVKGNMKDTMKNTVHDKNDFDIKAGDMYIFEPAVEVFKPLQGINNKQYTFTYKLDFKNSYVDIICLYINHGDIVMYLGPVDFGPDVNNKLTYTYSTWLYLNAKEHFEVFYLDDIDLNAQKNLFAPIWLFRKYQ